MGDEAEYREYERDMNESSGYAKGKAEYPGDDQYERSD
jgi:hypothetical protein